jgi:hypothetical protein
MTGKNVVGYFRPPRVGQDLIKKLERANPNRNLLFNAIETLKTPEEMRTFYREYVEYMRLNGNNEEIKANAERVAKENIGYVIGYYNEETGNRWMKALPEVYHPIFGRDIFKVTPDEAFRKGVELGEKMKREERRR